MATLTDNERALYGQTLVEMTNDELMHERLVKTNEMFATNVDVVSAKQEPKPDGYIELLQETAVRAMQRLQMVNSEIESRREETPHVEMSKQAQEAALNTARAAALKNMIERARDLTDLMTTTRSMILQLAGDLPSEGRYDPVQWSYKTVVAGAQDAVKTLVEAWTLTQDAQHQLEMAVRQISNMQQHFEREQGGADPDDYQPDDPEADGIPF